MNAVFIAPTGLGLNIGGHAGDACWAVKLIGECCDKIITHPNAVNASDLNEMPENTLYVEGSILDRFISGSIYLQERNYNKILLCVNPPVSIETVNAVNAARAVMGADIKMVELETPLRMRAYIESGRAKGEVYGWEELCEQINFEVEGRGEKYAVGIQSLIEVDPELEKDYFKGKVGINPWGGVEAKASKLIADRLDCQVAHAPIESGTSRVDNEVVDPRMSAEMVSMCFLHCILKGLHRSPALDYYSGLSNDDIDVLITPMGCYGEVHKDCAKNGIPIIVVKENTPAKVNDLMREKAYYVESYLEAAGLIQSWKAGVHYVDRQ